RAPRRSGSRAQGSRGRARARALEPHRSGPDPQGELQDLAHQDQGPRVFSVSAEVIRLLQLSAVVAGLTLISAMHMNELGVAALGTGSDRRSSGARRCG